MRNILSMPSKVPFNSYVLSSALLSHQPIEFPWNSIISSEGDIWNLTRRKSIWPIFYLSTLLFFRTEIFLLCVMIRRRAYQVSICNFNSIINEYSRFMQFNFPLYCATYVWMCMRVYLLRLRYCLTNLEFPFALSSAMIFATVPCLFLVLRWTLSVRSFVRSNYFIISLEFNVPRKTMVRGKKHTGIQRGRWFAK